MLQNGLTALHLAAKEGRYNIVFELLKRGADLNATSKVACLSHLSSVGNYT